MERATIEPARAASIDEVGTSLDNALLIITSRIFLRAMSILIACHPTMVEGLTITADEESQCLTSSRTSRILNT